ncbi:MAG TPA: DUF420 domain-containing protein [Verrucomicrobiae bacterium]|jgi:uncharacterized membrane protein YozB (DUF420 family)
MTVHDLPAVNATLNGLSAIFLGAGYWFIRKKNVPAHRACMISAFTTSVLFLCCYLTYHIVVKAVTKFLEPAWFKPFYFTLLASHIILAFVIIPLILITLTRAAMGQFDRHRAIARWTWPLWMYVSVTGVMVYLILYQIYPQR